MAAGTRSRRRFRLPGLPAAVGFGVSVGIAGSVAFGVGSLLQDKNAELTALTRRDDLVVLPTAQRVLGAGTVLTAADLESLRIAASFVPDGAARDPEEILGRTVKERLLPGEAIRLVRLTAKDVQPGLAALVGEGSRAVSLEVSHADRVSGFIEPGCAVDLIVTFPKERDVPAETVTMGQNLRVLAVDEVLSETAKGEEPVTREQVTLAMNPIDAERILHAVHVGEPRLTLRSGIDHEVAPVAASPPPRRLGTVSLDIREWWEAFTPAAFAAMQARLDRERLPEALPVDRRLIRPLNTP